MQEPINESYRMFVGKICIGYLKSGHKFAARLLEIKDGTFIFESKAGLKFIDLIADVTELAVMIHPGTEA